MLFHSIAALVGLIAAPTLLGQTAVIAGADVRGAFVARIKTLCDNAATAPAACASALRLAQQAWAPGERPTSDQVAAALKAIHDAGDWQQAEPSDPGSARLLSILALEFSDETYRTARWGAIQLPIEPLADMLLRSAQAGVRDPDVLRACAGFALSVRDAATARHCIALGAATGMDSAWIELRLAWLAARNQDTAEVVGAFQRAVRQGTRPSGWAEVGSMLVEIVDDLSGGRARQAESVLARQASSRLGRSWGSLRFWLMQQRGFDPELLSAERFPGWITWEFRQFGYRGPGFRPCIDWLTSAASGGFLRRSCNVDELSYTGERRDLPVRGRLYRLWRLDTGESLAVVGYILPFGEPTARGELSVRQFAADDGWFADTSVNIGLPRDGSREEIRGLRELASRDGVTSWTVRFTEDGGRRGRIRVDAVEPIAADGFAVSDIVLGQVGNGTEWDDGRSTVIMQYGDSFERKRPIELYMQVRSGPASREVMLRLSVEPLDRGSPSQRKALAMEFAVGFQEPLSAFRRSLDLSRLGRGDYRVVVSARRDGVVLARQAVGLSLK